MNRVSTRCPTFRPAVDSDADFLWNLYREVRKEEMRQVGLPCLPDLIVRLQFTAREQSRAAQYPNAQHLLLLSEENGEPIGALTVADFGHTLHLVDIALLPANRGQGIGTKVLESLQAEAAEREIPLTLSVATGNTRARRLYRRLGFVEMLDAESTNAPVYWTMSWSNYPSNPAQRVCRWEVAPSGFPALEERNG